MNRVVVDANVYVSALVFGGVPQQVFDLIVSRSLDLCISRSIIDEVTETLTAKFGWTESGVATLLPSWWDRCTLVQPSLQIDVCTDPDDNHVLECAIAAGAEFLITGNLKHFPKTYQGVTVVSPRQWVNLNED